MASQVSTRGQITIDRAVRKELGVEPGLVAVQVVVEDHLEVYFVPAPHRRSLFASLPPMHPAAINDWGAVEERAARSIAEEA